MEDFFGREIKVGDYIVYSILTGRSNIDLFIAKVIGFTPETIKVIRPGLWSHDRLVETKFKVPERAIIISKEQALEKEPLFKDLIN